MRFGRSRAALSAKPHTIQPNAQGDPNGNRVGESVSVHIVMHVPFHVSIERGLEWAGTGAAVRSRP